MTKVTILGQDEPKKEFKKIELTGHIDSDFMKNSVCDRLDDWENITLIARNYLGTGLDIMLCYDKQPSGGVLHLGHFNDGIV